MYLCALFNDLTIAYYFFKKLNIMHLGLDHLYQMHDDYVMEMIEKTRIYRGPMADALSTSFPNAGYTHKDVYDFVWGKKSHLLQRQQTRLHTIVPQIRLLQVIHLQHKQLMLLALHFSHQRSLAVYWQTPLPAVSDKLNL